MPAYLVDQGGNRIGYSDVPDPVDDPPAPPTGLVAVAGDGQVSLSWNPSPETDLADYRVRLTSPTDSLLATVTSPSHVVTGLTNGQSYTFTVRARDAGGNVSSNSNTATATPAAPVTGTKFGYNTADDAPLAVRRAKWGNRAPMVRRYSGNAFNLNNGVFPFTTAICPEKGLSYSIKANSSGAYTKAGLANGNGNSMLVDWLESAPPGWMIDVCYFHEVNDDIREGNITIAQYRDTYEQFRTAIDSADLAAGTTVKLSSNFMAYRIADTPTYFDDSWVPPVGVADRMTIDIYGNPGHFTSQVLAPNCKWSGTNPVTGPEYGASFPNVNTRFRDSLEAIVRNGFGQHWGVLELNTPPREFDGPVNLDYVCGSVKQRRYQGGRTASGHDSTHTEVERAAWLTAAIEKCLNPGTVLGEVMAPAEIVLIWEHPMGTNWNQAFLHDNVWNAIKPYMLGSP